MPYQDVLGPSAALPLHGSERWAVRTGKLTRHLESRSAVRSELRRWTPMRPLLIGEPGGERFRLPTDVEDPGIRHAAARAARRYFTSLALMLVLVSMPLIVLNAWFGVLHESFWLALTWLALAGLFFRDARVVLARPHHLRERAAFFYWLRTLSSARTGGVAFVLALAAMAGVQLFAMAATDGLPGAFHSYGLLYPRVIEGEAWRLLTGAFLHYSAGHFLLNAVLVVTLGALAWAFHDWGALLIFTVGSVFSMAAQMLLGGQVHDNAAGVSGGAYALGALVLTTAWGRSRTLPPGLALQLLGLIAIGILGSELSSPAAATAAHVGGAFVGAIVGAALSSRLPTGPRAWRS